MRATSCNCGPPSGARHGPAHNFQVRLNRIRLASVTWLVALLRLTPSFSSAPIVLASCGVLGAVAPVGAATAEAKRSFDLPRGDAATTLRQFAAASGRSLVFVTDKVRGETTNAVRGEFTPREALERMLAGSALEAAQDAATGALIVSRKRVANAAPRTGEIGPVSDPQPNPQTKPMKSPRTLIAAFAGWLAAATAVDAQTAPPAAATSADELVTLPAFSVSSERANGYRATDSMSAARIRTPIVDTPATVNVITGDFLKDIGAASLFDATQYVSGIGNGRLSGGSGILDRHTIRGYENDGRTIDNFASSFQANLTPLLYERVEIVKGPNAILAPTGTPGGSINVITKAPSFTQANVAQLELGRHLAHKAGLLADGIDTGHLQLGQHDRQHHTGQTTTAAHVEQASRSQAKVALQGW